MLNLIFFILIAAFWGSSFIAIKIVLGSSTPLAGAAIRASLGAITLWAVFKVQKKAVTPPPGSALRLFVAALVGQTIPFYCLFLGQEQVPPGLAGVLDGTIPLWAFLFGLVLLRHVEKFTYAKFMALGFGALGMAILCWPMLQIKGTPGELIGTFWVTVMAASYGLALVFTRLLMTGKRPVSIPALSFHQMWISAVLLLLLLFIKEGLPDLTGLKSPKVAVATLYLGIFPTAIAWLMFTHLVRVWGAIRASATTYAIPIFALWFDYLFFGRIPEPTELVGAGVILLAIVMLNFGSLPRLLQRAWQLLSTRRQPFPVQDRF